MKTHRSVLVRAMVLVSIGIGTIALHGASGTFESRTDSIEWSNKAAASAQDDKATSAGSPRDLPFASVERPIDELCDCTEPNPDYPLRTMLNGERLPLDYNRLSEKLAADMLANSRLVSLSDGRLLAGLGDTLYMLDRSKRVLWKHTVTQILFDFAVVESTGLVYGTAGDNEMFILDAGSGKSLYRNGRNGSAAYGQAVPFGTDICLITDNFWGYRHGPPASRDEESWVMPDGISAWRGITRLWSMDFPPDASLVVNGNKILAVTKTNKAIYVREVIPPASDSRVTTDVDTDR